jgi:hypothetical protein
MSELFNCKTCHRDLSKDEFIKDEKQYKTCNICRDAVNSNRRKHICQVCGIKGVFNIKGEITGIRCKTHKELNMIDVTRKYCQVCNKKQPVFNFEGKLTASHCADCKEVGMINVKDKKCQVCKKKQPNFNFEGKLTASHCADCKEVGMINVKHKKCQICNKTRPNFNFEGKSIATHCADCKEVGMIDIKSKKCQVCNETIPNFNFEGKSIATHCADCKEVGMIDIKNKKCQICNKTRPNFNFEGKLTASHCADCKEVGMIDVKHKKCQICNKTRSNFNFEGKSIATHCADCKEAGMIDIKNKKCEIENCKTRSSYGYLNQKLSRCGKHKLPLMFKKTKPICNDEKCNDIAEYGTSEPLHCEFHKSNDDLHLVGTTCKGCNRENELCNNDGLCLTYCRPNEIYQNAKQYIKKKESYVLAYLDKNITVNRKPIDDSIIDSSCVRRRPDRVYDLGFVYLIIEIDEFQHKSYHSGCVFDKDTQELRRMNQISEALSMNQIPCIFIRFNPDGFSVDGKKQKVNMAKRLEILKKWIEYIQKMKPEDFENEMEIQIKYLFYNEYKEEDLSFQKITEEMMKKMIIH